VAHRVVRLRGSYIFGTIGSQMGVSLLALCAGRATPPRKIPSTHFCSRLSRSQGHSTAGRIRSVEKSNDPIGNRSRDIPACSEVPQSTTLLRVLISHVFLLIYEHEIYAPFILLRVVHG
jgi:hypothetical protein